MKKRPHYQPPKPPPEVECRMQGGDFVTQAWCDFAQYELVCAGCPRNLGRDVSRYQEEVNRDKQNGASQ